MKRIFILVISLMCVVAIYAQEQQGYARTAGKPNRQGQPIENVLINITRNDNVRSDSDGQFSFVPQLDENDDFTICGASKRGYELCDVDFLRKKHSYDDSTPFEIVMISREELLREQAAIEDRLYKEGEARYQARIEALEKQLKESRIDRDKYLAQKDSLEKEFARYETLISELTNRYARMDFDALSGDEVRIAEAITSGQLQRADSLIHAQGDPLQQANEIIENQKEREALEKAIAIDKENEQKVIPIIAKRLYAMYEIKAAQFENDSAAIYLEKRAALDTTNYEWQYVVGNYFYTTLIEFEKAEYYYQRALNIAKQQLGENSAEVAQTQNKLAKLYSDTNQLQEAEELYKQALEIHIQLAEQHPESYLSDVALISNNLAALYYKTNRLQEAEDIYKQALGIRTQLAEQHPESYLTDVADTQNNLAALYYKTNRLQEAEVLYKQALETYTQLAEKYPEANLPDVAMTQNNLATLYYITNRLQEAEVFYKKALETYTQLAEKYPEANLPDVAMTQNNLAELYSNTNRLQEAEILYKQALKIRTQLAEKYPEAYLPNVAMTQNNLAELYSNTNRLQEAEILYNKALEIRTQLAEKSPDAYLPDVATTQNDLAILLNRTNRFEEALSMAQKALETYTILNNLFNGYFINDIQEANRLIDAIKKAL